MLELSTQLATLAFMLLFVSKALRFSAAPSAVTLAAVIAAARRLG